MRDTGVGPGGVGRWLVLAALGTAGLVILPHVLRGLARVLHQFDRPPEFRGALTAEHWRFAVWGMAFALIVGALIRLLRRL